MYNFSSMNFDAVTTLRHDGQEESDYAVEDSDVYYPDVDLTYEDDMPFGFEELRGEEVVEEDGPCHVYCESDERESSLPFVFPTSNDIRPLAVLHGGGLSPIGVRVSNGDGVFSRRLDLFSSYGFWIYKGQPVLEIQVPNTGIDLLPLATMTSLMYNVGDHVIAGGGPPNYVLQGCRPKLDGYEVFLIRLRLVSGWVSVLVYPTKIVQCESDSVAVFEEVQDKLYLLTDYRPNTDFDYHRHLWYSYGKYVDSRPSDGLVCMVDGVEYKVKSQSEATFRLTRERSRKVMHDKKGKKHFDHVNYESFALGLYDVNLISGEVLRARVDRQEADSGEIVETALKSPLVKDMPVPCRASVIVDPLIRCRLGPTDLKSRAFMHYEDPRLMSIMLQRGLDRSSKSRQGAVALHMKQLIAAGEVIWAPSVFEEHCVRMGVFFIKSQEYRLFRREIVCLKVETPLGQVKLFNCPGKNRDFIFYPRKLENSLLGKNIGDFMTIFPMSSRVVYLFCSAAHFRILMDLRGQLKPPLCKGSE